MLGVNELDLKQVFKIVFEKGRVEIDPLASSKVAKSFSFLEKFAADKVIYGINTGFGPMAEYKISEEEQINLQYNLIRSHCTGAGNPLPMEFIRATMLCRLNSLLQGYSGINPAATELLKEFLNHSVYPLILEHGGVGASGDLVQLAHLALCLIGEGEVFYQGEKQPTDKVLKEVGLEPLSVYMREGLAIMNGTSTMTGVGLVNVCHAKNLLNISCLMSSLLNEIVNAYGDSISVELNQVKRHPEQQEIAKSLRNILSDSKCIKNRSEHLYQAGIKDGKLNDKVQEYYSIRCLPQILGPILKAVQGAEEVVLNEANSANDNPIIDAEIGDVFHGGNFHGDYVSFEMDKLKIAITKLSMLTERQLNYMVNHRINEILPPFVNMGKLGLNFGVQGMQFTATSTVAENQSVSFPNYVHSIPNNNDNQDIVSMGANSALLCNKVIENTYQVFAIQAVALAQGVDLLKLENNLSSKTKAFYNEVRNVFPSFHKDTPTYEKQQKVIEFFKSKMVDSIK